MDADSPVAVGSNEGLGATDELPLGSAVASCRSVARSKCEEARSVLFSTREVLGARDGVQTFGNRLGLELRILFEHAQTIGSL